MNNRIKKELKMKILILGGMGGFGVMGAMADEYGVFINQLKIFNFFSGNCLSMCPQQPRVCSCTRFVGK